MKPKTKTNPRPKFRHTPEPPLVFLKDQADLDRVTEERKARLEPAMQLICSEALRMRYIRGPKGVNDRLTCWRQKTECIGFAITLQIDITA